MIKPIRPEEVSQLVAECAIQVFNTLIKENWDGKCAKFKQEDVVTSLMECRPDFTRDMIFKRKMLDVEATYRAVGWKVVYDKPGYSETYPANFTFSRD